MPKVDEVLGRNPLLLQSTPSFPPPFMSVPFPLCANYGIWVVLYLKLPGGSGAKLHIMCCHQNRAFTT